MKMNEEKRDIIEVEYESIEGYTFHFTVTYECEVENHGHVNYNTVDILNVDFRGDSITSLLSSSVIGSLKLKAYIKELDRYSEELKKLDKEHEDREN